MITTNHDIFLASYDGKPKPLPRNTRQRLQALVEYLDTMKLMWYELDLLEYRQYLTEVRLLAPHSVNVFLAAVRTAYRELLENEEELRLILRQYPQMSDNENIEIAMSSMAVAADNRTAYEKVERPKSDHQWYTIEQVEQLLDSIDITTLKGMRDFAVVSTLLATGVRDTELVNLQVSDLYHNVENKHAFHVPNCYQCVERLVEYGEMFWLRGLVETWLTKANIRQGFIFRGVTQKGEIRENGLSVRAVYNILAQYPIMVDDEPQPLSILNIRHTYSKVLYKAGVPIETIRQNLGFDSDITTIQYIGKLDKPDVKPRVYKTLKYIDVPS